MTSSRAENHAVAQVKVKTLNGKTKYSVISNGSLANYNDYVGYSRKVGKKLKKLKKINAETQELKMSFVNINMRVASTGAKITPKEGLTYYYIPRSEW